MSESALGKSEMSSAVMEAAQLVQTIAEPRPVSDSVKSAIGRSARALRWTYSRTKDVWYRNARRIDSAEMDRLREAAARRETELAINRVLALRQSLATSDADFHRETIDHLGHALRRMGLPLDAAGE